MGNDIMKNKLFVIGNGFDLAHNLKTKYSDFLEYLRQIINKDVLNEYTENEKMIQMLCKNNGFVLNID